ncbi:MAG: sulfur carrier protein ThiS [Bryobacterales bacterium]|nr:sulfur carrier protein ThiS [Bryobacterales bacterium]
MIEIVVNGETRQVPEGTTVTGLLALLGVAPERVAVELDRAIIKNIFWSERGLKAGARVEVVHFVGGGERGWASSLSIYF